MATKCKKCGEQIAKTGNYSMRILPAKRIPKKARKIAASESLREDEQGGSAWGTTKFQKFLMKRSKPFNLMEITCGKCGGSSKIKMDKQFPAKDRTGNETVTASSESISPNLSTTETRKTHKKQTDRSAGLTLAGSSKKQDGLSRHSPGNKSKSKMQRQKELDNLNKMLFSSKKAKKSGSTLQDFLSSI